MIRRPLTVIFTLSAVLGTLLAWGLVVLLAWLTAPPAGAQTEYVYGDVECGLGPDQCSLRGFSIPGGIAQGTVDFDHLSSGVQIRLDSAVKWAQGSDGGGEPSLDGRELGFLNGAEDATRTLTLPTPCESPTTTPHRSLTSPVLSWDRTANDCVWKEDATATGGSGLDASGVRTQVRGQLTEGAGITLTQTGTGAAQTLAIASTVTDTTRSNTEIRAQVEGAVQAGTNVTVTPSGTGASRIVTIAATDTDTQRSDTYLRAETEAQLQAGANVTITPSGTGADRLLTIASTATGGGGEQSHLAPLAAVPAIAGYAVGDIADVAGELYELVDDADEGHILRGTVGQDGSYRGASRIAGQSTAGSWSDPAYEGEVEFFAGEGAGIATWRARLPRAVLSGPPATIYATYQDQRGEVADIVLNRDSARDTTNTWAYASAPDEADADTPVGDTFAVLFFSNTARSAALVVHSTDRWEQYARRKATPLPPAVTADEAAKGTDTDVRLWSPERVHEAIDALGQVPDGTSFPDDPNVGEQFILLADDDVPIDPIRTFYQAQSTLRQLSIGGGTGHPSDLRSFNTSYSGPAAATIRGKTYVIFRGARAKTANRVWLYRAGQHSRSFIVNTAQSQVTGEPNWYEVMGLDYATAAVGDWHVNVGYTDGTKQFADQTFSLGHYIYVGGSRGWMYAPGTAAVWATQGRPEPATLLAITERSLGTSATIIVTDSGATTPVHGAMAGFSPTFDLDTPINSRGTIQVECTLTITDRGNPPTSTIGFDARTTEPLSTTQARGFTFASNVRAQPAYLQAIGSQFNGIQIGQDVPVHNGSGVLSGIEVYLAHDANNELGVFLAQDPGSGALGFSISATCNMEFLHNDAPAVLQAISGISVEEDGTLEGTAGTVTAIDFAGDTSVTLSAGEVIVTTPARRSDTDIDGRIATYALRTNPTGTIADAQIPQTIARDTELPVLPPTVTQAEAEAGTNSSTRLWTPERVNQAIAARAPTYTTRGPEWISTSALPTSAALTNSRGRIPIGLIASADAPAGTTVSGTTAYAALPRVPPTYAVDGLWIVSSVDGVELSAIRAVWGPNVEEGISVPEQDHIRLLVRYTSSSAYLEILIALRYDVAGWNLNLIADETQTTVPAPRTHIRIYPSGIFPVTG